MTTSLNQDPLLSTKEAAEYLNRHPNTLINDRYLGKGARYTRLGRLIRYRKSDLDAYIESNIVEVV